MRGLSEIRASLRELSSSLAACSVADWHDSQPTGRASPGFLGLAPLALESNRAGGRDERERQTVLSGRRFAGRSGLRCIVLSRGFLGLR